MNTSPRTTPTGNETQGQAMTGAEILVQALIQHGCEVLFAYPGGASMPLHQALLRHANEIRTILPRHEQGGGFAAQGFARATGRPGVCMATSGPGATNLVTPIADAKLDSIPLIAITGQVKTGVIGSDAFQETPIVEVCRGITKQHYLVTDVNDITRIVKEAFHIASTGRPGPVLIDLPKDVQEACIIPDWDPPMALPGYTFGHVETRSHEVQQVANAIARAKRPLIFAGGGIVSGDASDELREFVKKTRIPVALTVMGLGVFPNEDSLCLDMIGMHGSVYSNLAMDQADLILALGVRFDDRVTGKLSEFAKDATIVHVDIDASELNKNKVAHIPVCSHVKSFLQALVGAVHSTSDLAPWHAQCAEWKRNDPFSYDHSGDEVIPQHAISELWKLTIEHDPIYAVGVGQHQMWSAQFLKFRSPRTWLCSSGLGTMGFGLPAAMGAQIAFPDRLIIDIDGDGSFQMNIQELATCHCERIPVKVLLLDNQHLGMVMQWEDRFMEGRRAHTYLGPIDHREATGDGTGSMVGKHYPDFTSIAKGYGCGAATVSSKRDLTDAIRDMVAYDGPFVLTVQVPYQEHVLPMIPSGMTVRDLIKS